MVSFPTLSFRGSGNSSVNPSTSASTPTGPLPQAKEREQSPISDIAEDDAIAAANIEHALETVNAAKAFMEAATAEAGASAGSEGGLIKVEAKRAGEGDVTMAQATQEREEGEVEEEVDELTDEPISIGAGRKEGSERGVRESVPSPSPFPHSSDNGEERNAAATVNEQALQVEQVAVSQPVLNANPAPAPQQQDEDIEMQILSSNIPPPASIRSPTPPRSPIQAVTIVIRDAHGYGTNFCCKPSSKSSSPLSFFPKFLTQIH